MSEQTLSDLEVYKSLTAAADDLDRLSTMATSLIGEAALQTAANSVRGMANAVYEHALNEDGGRSH
jgi:hypothetical protein